MQQPQQTRPHTARPPLFDTLAEPTARCTSQTQHNDVCTALIGWPEGSIWPGLWLDAGGPIDATAHIPVGGAQGKTLHNRHTPGGVHVLSGCIARDGGQA